MSFSISEIMEEEGLMTFTAASLSETYSLRLDPVGHQAGATSSSAKGTPPFGGNNLSHEKLLSERSRLHLLKV